MMMMLLLPLSRCQQGLDTVHRFARHVACLCLGPELEGVRL
jgi:hypothetical protein